MGANPFLGVFFHWLGGLASGSFYVPFKGVKKWSWETYWLVGGFFSWIICPMAFAFFMTNDLVGVIKSQSASTLWWTYFFGVLWGLGGLTFGLTLGYLGVSLGMGVALGYCAAFGTLVPPIAKAIMPDLPVGSSIIEIARTTSGQVTLAGVGVCLVGIGIAALAGFTKEKEMPEEEKRKVIKEFNFKKGIVVATFSGIMSACFAFALQAAKPINEATKAAKTAELWTGLPALVILLWGGFTTNFIWCVLLNFKNATGYQYLASEIRPEHAHHGGSGGGGGWLCARGGGRHSAGGFENTGDGKLPPFRPGRNDVVFSIFLLHDGRHANGEIRLCVVDVAHGEHHYFQHDVGLDIARMEGIQQKSP